MGYRIMILDRVNKKILRFDKNTRKLLYDYISKNLKDTDNPKLHGKALTGNLKGLTNESFLTKIFKSDGRY